MNALKMSPALIFLMKFQSFEHFFLSPNRTWLSNDEYWRVDAM